MLCLYLYLYNSTFGKNSTGARPHHGTGSCILGNHKDVQYGSRISSQKNHEAQRNVPQKHEGQRNVTAVKEIMLYSPPTYRRQTEPPSASSRVDSLQTFTATAAADKRVTSQDTSVVIKSSPAINNTWLTPALKLTRRG